jgi:hypothetical protein
MTLSSTSIVVSRCLAFLRRLTITCLFAALTLGAFVVVAPAQTRPTCGVAGQPCWPPLANNDGTPCVWPACTPVLTETYFDVPWTQKLGTFRTNEIDEPLVLPYAALDPSNKRWCGTLSEARCMIETGINSIIRIDRTDTLYDYNNANTTIKTAKRCGIPGVNAGTCTPTDLYCGNSTGNNSQPCIEVRLELSMYWNRGGNALTQRQFGNEPGPPYTNGVVVSDGTTYGPQMPWYMSHYCSNQQNGPATNAVCNTDYFSETNDGFNGDASAWPKSPAAWSVWPSAIPPAPSNHCAPANNPNPSTPANWSVCVLVLAGFDLYPLTENTPAYVGQYQAQNVELFNWFNTGLQDFSNTTTPPANTSVQDLQRHFPWPGTWPGGRSLDPAFTWANYVFRYASADPFQGLFSFTGDPTQPLSARPDHFLYPRRCKPTDLANAFTNGNASTLRQCGLNYEFHFNGWGATGPARTGAALCRRP